MTKRTSSFWLIALSICLSLGQLTRWQVTPNVAIYVQDCLVVGLVGWYGFRSWKRGKLKTLFRSKIAQLILGLLVWSSLGLLLNTWVTQSWQLGSWLRLGRLGLYCGFGLAWWHYSQNWSSLQRKNNHWLIGLVGILIAWLGVVQYIWLPDLRFLRVLGWDDHLYRLVSTWLDPAFTGAALMVAWFVAQTLLKAYPRWQVAVQVFLLVTIVLTFSRATYLAWLVSLYALAWLQRPKVLQKPFFGPTIAWTLLFMGLVILSPKPEGEGVNLSRTSTIVARAEGFESVGKDITIRRLVIGNGLYANQTNTPYPSHNWLPDNLLATWLIGTGIPGLIIFVCLIWQLWKQGHLVLPKPLRAVWLGLLVHSLFNNTLLQPQILLLVILTYSSFAETKVKN